MPEKANNPELDFARISVLYENSYVGYFGIVAGILWYAYIIDNLATVDAAIPWALLVSCAYIPRLFISYQFSRKIKTRAITPENIRPWERYFLYCSVVPFLCFSGAVFIPYGESEFNALLFFTVIVMTLVSGSILSYSTSLPAVFLFMNASMLPLIAKTLSMQEPLFTALGSMLVIAYLLLTRLIPRQHKLLVENIALRIENGHQSLTDPLTKLGNRRRLNVSIETLIPSAIRRDDPFTIVLLDIDHFKQYNDEYGHTAGDELLVKVSTILKECSRDQDLVIRYGGEEFLLVLPSTNLQDGKILVDRIRDAFMAQTDITFSAGIAMHASEQSFDKLIELADQCMYRAKTEGRDRYVLAPHSQAENAEPGPANTAST